MINKARAGPANNQSDSRVYLSWPKTKDYQ